MLEEDGREDSRSEASGDFGQKLGVRNSNSHLLRDKSRNDGDIKQHPDNGQGGNRKISEKLCLSTLVG